MGQVIQSYQSFGPGIVQLRISDNRVYEMERWRDKEYKFLMIQCAKINFG